MRVYKRGGVWWLQYCKGCRQYRRSLHTTVKKDAVAFAERIMTAARMPTFEEAVDVLRILYRTGDEGGLAVGDAWSEYERIAKAVGRDAVATSTARMREGHFKAFAAWLDRERPRVRTVQQIDGRIAADYAAALAESGAKTKTRANTIGDLGSVWKLLKKAAPGIEDVWTSLRPRDTDGERREAFSAAQEADVLAAAKRIGKDWYPVCLVARHTGLRYGDIARLTWAEADLAAGVIRKTPSKTARHGVTVALPMIAPVADALREVRDGQQAAGVYEPDGFCFRTHAEFYGNRGNAARKVLAFGEVLAAAGVKGNYSFHSWRHTAATRLAEAGADIETRKRILGHTEDVTARRYDHDEHLAETRAAMEAAAGAEDKKPGSEE